MSSPLSPSPSEPSLPKTDLKEQHLIVVSNRLPITITKDAQGEYHFKMSSGGLVSALSGTKKSMTFTWIGWPGFYIPPKDREVVDRRLLEEFSCQAVYLDDDVAERHYNGFSNSILWPLFHYHPGEMNFDEDNWLAYRQANLAFADAVMTQIRPNSMVWVQDYHLMLLPMLLRALVTATSEMGEYTTQELANITDGIDLDRDTPVSGGSKSVPGVKIGFFLHTPFPSSEIYRHVARGLPIPSEQPLMRAAPQDSARPPRDPARRALLRPHRLPHVRLRAPLPLLVHARAFAPDDAERRRVRGPPRTRRHVPHRY
jgi:trehalose 6-phosphate synthase